MSDSSDRSHLDTQQRYRRDIDGLRALAVIAVIAFHYGGFLAGGFIGVDIFFVISGYLVTGIIERSIRDNRFSMFEFWLRRARRILPAVIVVNLCVLVAGYAFFLPYVLVQAAKSSIAQVFFVSNFYFWRDRDYFNQESELKPLLHTWSLAVEEQFYLLLPLLLIAMQLVFRKHQPAVRRNMILLLAAVSLALSAIGVLRSPAATFYLLPTRAWELLAGSWLAINEMVGSSRPFNRKLQIWIENLSLLCLVVLSFYYVSSIPFPGPTAIPVVFATMMLVRRANSSTDEDTSHARTFLAVPLLVFIGKRSYSLYLWHWPILVFTRYVLDRTLSVIEILVVCFVTVLCTLVSYRWIEEPVRRQRLFKGNSAFFKVLFCSIAVIVGASTWFILSDGCRWRTDSAVIDRPENPFVSKFNVALREGLPLVGLKTTEPKFIVWGDSHTAMSGYLFDRLAKQHNLTGVIASSSSSPPLPGVYNGWNDRLEEWNDFVWHYIVEHRIENVFLIARWSSYIEGETEDDLRHGTTFSQTLIRARGDQGIATRDRAGELFKRAVDELVALSHKPEIDFPVRFYFVSQVPEQTIHATRRYFLSQRTFGWIPMDELGTDIDTHQKYQSRVDAISQSVRDGQFRIIDSDAQMFRDSLRSPLVRQQRLIYYDTHHLTEEGVEYAWSEPIDEILKGL